MAQADTLYDQVVDITYEYLGPAADRFVARQIRRHLDKQPENLKKRDLNELLVWINLAMNLLVDDEKLVDSYIADLNGLTENGPKRRKAS